MTAPRRTPQPILMLDAVEPADLRLVGAKAANLARLLKAGFPVPEGFCLTTAAYERFIAATSARRLLEELSALDPSKPQGIAAVGTRIRARLAAVAIPTDIATAVHAAWDATGPQHVYAVRSSATTEDLASASFAGQHDTFLNVRGYEDLLTRIRACWASLFTDRAILYCLSRGIRHDQAAMAVLVQGMVPADAAGVMFTGDTITIEATPGLGEALVAGSVTPDRLILNPQTLQVIERSIASSNADSPSAPDHVLRELADLGRRVQDFFAQPQDIEWAIHNQRIWLLQSRPITAPPPPRLQTQAPAQSSAPRYVWSNVNAGEVLPDVVTPLTWSVTQRFLNDFFDPFLRPLGIDMSKDPWFGLVAGRVYANVSVFASLFRSVPGGIDLDHAFGGLHNKLPPGETIPEDLLRPAAQPAWYTAVRSPGLLLRLMRYWSIDPAYHYVRELRRHINAAAQTDLRSLSTTQLLDRFLGRGVGFKIDHTAMPRAMMAMVCVSALQRLCARWFGPQEGAAVANGLLSDAGNMASAAPALDLWRLAAWTRSQPSVVTVLGERRGFAATAALLQLDAPGRQFLEQWDQFMLRHGHHVRGEADIHIPRWSETPDVVLDVLRGYVSADGAAPPAIEQRQHTRQQLLARCDCRARNPLSRALLRWLARRAQHGLVMRENLKSELVRVVALARQTVLELSRRLVASGVFRQIDDVFFLSQEELDDVVRGQPDVSALGRTIGERRGEYELYCSITPPPVVIGTFDPHRYAQQARRDQTPHQQPVAVILHGLCVSPGHVVGRARVILRADTTQQVLPGEILVAPFTDPGWTLHFVTAAGIVMDMGGLLSHGSIVAREYGIPAVVNVGPATTLIKTGQLLDVDANRGVVTLLESPAATSDISMNAGPADVSCRGG